jgi:aryl-alcohol dehydrogenase-like predicted oxidoreductase
MPILSTSLPGGTWTLGDLAVTRCGYGAMQLAGPGVMGPPADHDGALAVLREAAGLGITHIDTSDAYGPHVTNQLTVALAWLLQRSPNILLIPGTSSPAHLRENVAGAGLSLSGKELAELDAIGR